MLSAPPRSRPAPRSHRPPLTAAAIALAAALVTGCGGQAGGHRAAAGGRGGPTRVPATPSSAAPSPSTRPSSGPSVIAVPAPPPRLPQTRAFPSASTRVFRAEMTDLWTAVVTGVPRFGAQAFFPLSAYTQVKAIADPAADWQTRLFAAYRSDIGAAHGVVGRGARLVRVIVPSSQAAWIDPGVCYNAVGYWHVAGSRLVYQQHGQIRSIGIASLISWRGRWYVVHFGAVLRTGTSGLVDAPAIGPGVPGPPGGC